MTGMSGDDRNVHSDWVAWLQFARDLDRNAIAQRLGVSSAAVSSWVTGAHAPRQDYWQAMVTLVGCSIGEYWCGPSRQLSAVTQGFAVPEVLAG